MMAYGLRRGKALFFIDPQAKTDMLDCKENVSDSGPNLVGKYTQYFLADQCQRLVNLFVTFSYRIMKARSPALIHACSERKL